MARLLIGTEWYDSVSSSSFYEFEYEALLLEHARLLFPEYVMVPFKTTLSSEAGSCQADLALIERQYRCWWVVEVELAHHPINHLLRQVQVLSTASFGAGEATLLREQSPELDGAALAAMMKGAPPGVLVIVNEPKPAWISDLTRLGAIMTVVEAFRSERNHHVLRVNGAYPSTAVDAITTCHPDPIIPRLLVVDSPANLPFPPQGRFTIEYEGSVTEWERIQTRDRVWLSPVRSSPLPPRGRFVLVRGSGAHFSLRIFP